MLFFWFLDFELGFFVITVIIQMCFFVISVIINESVITVITLLK